MYSLLSVSEGKQHVCSSHIAQTEGMTVSLHTPHLISITKTTDSNQWGLDSDTSWKREMVT